MRAFGLLLPLVAAAAVTSPAAAAPGEVDLSLAAEVKSFCRIDAPAPRLGEDGAIGLVAEVCNTPGGYRVRASFTNLSQGIVLAGSERAAIDETGAATFTTSGPRRQQRYWSVEAARQLDRGRPVLVHLSVMPL